MKPFTSVKSKISVHTESQPLAQTIFKAISPEAKIPLGRSSTKIKLGNNQVNITISAEDITSLRATTTPLLRWIHMICEMWKIGGN
jgi:tRNA threonylcarbamoyladenosine modification (KEOPS) complex  Pcc1 subunit